LLLGKLDEVDHLLVVDESVSVGISMPQCPLALPPGEPLPVAAEDVLQLLLAYPIVFIGVELLQKVLELLQVHGAGAIRDRHDQGISITTDLRMVCMAMEGCFNLYSSLDALCVYREHLYLFPRVVISLL